MQELQAKDAVKRFMGIKKVSQEGKAEREA
jgi:hypothetical protein